jgi:hypothetical protein
MTQFAERLYQRACALVEARVSEVKSGKPGVSGFCVSVSLQHVEARLDEFVASCTAQGCVVSITPDIIVVTMTPS